MTEHAGHYLRENEFYRDLFHNACSLDLVTGYGKSFLYFDSSDFGYEDLSQ